MLDKTKYCRTYYVQNDRDKRLAVNSKHFKSMTLLGNDVSEVTAAYKSIKLEVHSLFCSPHTKFALTNSLELIPYFIVLTGTRVRGYVHLKLS